jgi:hypothetical protein
VLAAIPAIEVTLDAHGLRVWCPYGEGDAVDVAAGGFVVLDVRAEDVPQPLVPAFANEVKVHFPDGGEVAVRVVDGQRPFALVGRLEAVVRHVAGLQRVQHGHPYTVGLVVHGNGAGRRDDGDGLGQVLHGTYGDVPVVIEVCAEDRVRGVVLPRRDPRESVRVHGERSSGPIDPC